ncbi:heat shock factor-binding protein 1 [Crotalus adamanteus]|uniref:Heat shock factor-binding protein 1 n=6 Tax=Crotalinae TaxID=8710 RepID=A0AAW1ASH5_CROAD
MQGLERPRRLFKAELLAGITIHIIPRHSGTGVQTWREAAAGPAFSRRRPEAPGSRAWTGDREARQPHRSDMAETDPKTVQDLTAVVQTLLQQMQDKFQTMSDQIIGRIDDMSCRIDDLEKNIADLMTQAGVEELEGGENKAATTKTSSCQ